jgi:HTH-type transcriptional regulator/antitoxin HigA
LNLLLNAVDGTPEFDTLQVLSILVYDYEQKHYPIEPPDPVEAIKFRMEQQGLSTKDLEKVLGTKSKVSEVLNRKRDLSITMIRKAHKHLGISAETLIRSSKTPKVSTRRPKASG